ncbi:glycosyltransferase [Phenylobacterium sp. J367]|uniref:glycosyltransferase n=1 Tax=Phenylobacterium sp. J367 TaxID=2898435 RepID=UPI0021516185|nr:glycosyltransferase [Phenylobacterium sp. J367]MCR5880885.1 glycosyl transferase family 1 [Phenylobacterium sp. J367]
MKLAYFVHDLADPAVTRRVRMLVAGGAEPVVLGFRRTETAPETVAGVPAIDLGRTYDARMGQRAKATALAALGAGRFRDVLAGAEVVVGRTLEALAVAEAARTLCGLKARLVYECLDIHRLMLGEGTKSRAMRAVERALMRRADLLVVSSPAFLDHYFRPRQGVGTTLPLETLLVENKPLELDGAHPAKRPPPPAGPPWRVGWMGAIRCRKSLDILTDIATRRPDLLEVRIHGRPAYTEFADFDAQVAAAPGVQFLGPYTAQELPAIYGDVHFSWAFDYMEEGLNSAWLLPNRLYEAPRYGAVPVALASVETGRYLARRGVGVRLDDPRDLEAFLERLTPAAYARLRAEVDAVPAADLMADEADCRRLVEAFSRRGEIPLQPSFDPAEPYRAEAV